MTIDPISIPAAVSGGSAIGRLLGWLRQVSLKLEVAAIAKQSESGAVHYITLDVRIFNVGKAVTIRKVALIERPSWQAKLRNAFEIVERAPEVIGSKYGAPRLLPHYIATGDFQLLRFDTKVVWPPSRLKDMQLAVWHSCSNRPVRIAVEPPMMMLGANASGNALRTAIVSAP